MVTTQHTADEIARIGEAIYQRDIRPRVMPGYKGEFLVVEINTGEYEVDRDDLAASERLRVRVPDGEYFGLRIGFTTAYTLAGTMAEEQE